MLTNSFRAVIAAWSNSSLIWRRNKKICTSTVCLAKYVVRPKTAMGRTHSESERRE